MQRPLIRASRTFSPRRVAKGDKSHALHESEDEGEPFLNIERLGEDRRQPASEAHCRPVGVQPDVEKLETARFCLPRVGFHVRSRPVTLRPHRPSDEARRRARGREEAQRIPPLDTVNLWSKLYSPRVLWRTRGVFNRS